jgi:hypothetical protein
MPRIPERRAQMIDMFGEEAGPTVRQLDGEEEAAAADEIAPVTRHGGGMASGCGDGFR